MHPQLLARRRGQTPPGPGVTPRCVRQERRHPDRQEVGRRRHVGVPPLQRPSDNRLPAFGRRDARPRRHRVRHRLVARVPDAGPHLHPAPRHGPRHHLRLERRQVAAPTSATDHCHDVTSTAPEHRQRPGDRRRRTRALDRDLDVRDPKSETRSPQLTQEIAAALGLGARHETHVQDHVGQRNAGVATQQPFGLELAEQLGPLRGHPAEQRGHVDVGQGQAELTPGSIQIERSPQHHHHALGELDALLGQRVPQRRPRGAPTLDLEHRLAALRRRPAPPTTRRRLLLGFHQVQVQMPRPVVRQVLDLPAHPQVPAPGEGLGQRRLDLVIKAADREDALPLPSPGLRNPRRARFTTLFILAWRRLGVEEPAGATWRRRCCGGAGHWRPRYRCRVPLLTEVRPAQRALPNETPPMADHPGLLPSSEPGPALPLLPRRRATSWRYYSNPWRWSCRCSWRDT